jgi:tetratricopeptide (TPR) repeat protein
MAKRDLPKARESLSHFLELMPDHIDALCLLAKLAADEGQNQVVHQILDTIDNINPLLPQSHYLRALIYQQSEAWSEAKSALRRALYADRQFALAHYYMGEILFVEGNLALAHRSWENALNLLSKQAPERPVPFGDGMLTGTLIHAIEQRLNIR